MNIPLYKDVEQLEAALNGEQGQSLPLPDPHAFPMSDLRFYYRATFKCLYNEMDSPSDLHNILEDYNVTNDNLQFYWDKRDTLPESALNMLFFLRCFDEDIRLALVTGSDYPELFDA